MSASFQAEITIQAGTTSITLTIPGGVQPGDMAIAFVANKLDTATPSLPAGWNSLGSSVVGTGVAGAGTGPLRISAYWILLTQAILANPTFPITGGNVAMGYGQVWRKPIDESWRTPTATFGTDAVHDLSWATTGSSNLGLGVGDSLAVCQAGTANTGPTGRTVTVAGTTGTSTGINSAGSALGNQLFLWGERFTVATGASSAGPVSSGSFAANQSGGAAFVRVATLAGGQDASTPGGPGQTLKYHLNRKAGLLDGNGAPTVEMTKAANVWAGTTELTLTAALNIEAGNTYPDWQPLQGVLNQLAGTSGLPATDAAARIP